MRIGRFSKEGREFVGIIKGEEVFDLSNFFYLERKIQIKDINSLFENGLFSPEVFKKSLIDGEKYRELWYPLEKLNFSILYRPSKIICIGANYIEHAKESNIIIPEEPIFFEKATSAIIPNNGEIIYPEGLGRIDPEVELAVVIGKKAKGVEKEKADEFIAGYTILNDVTARDIEMKDMEKKLPWYRSKSIDTFCPFGPWIVTSDEINPEEDLKIELRVNGKIRQKSSTGKMLFKIPFLISFISKFITLYPGDIISTGTPEGISPIFPGDIVECEIEKIGILRNPVKKSINLSQK
ncbi:MAG: FAA hydrolase family protein [Candidatus Omnitrophota bacterium]|nr:MAG: FAA hydrolase family protein [Candidatus Omnitrophota bacterium]